MRKWFLVYYTEDMDRITEHFEMDIPLSERVPTKQMIENHLNISLNCAWNVQEVKITYKGNTNEIYYSFNVQHWRINWIST